MIEYKGQQERIVYIGSIQPKEKDARRFNSLNLILLLTAFSVSQHPNNIKKVGLFKRFLEFYRQSLPYFIFINHSVDKNRYKNIIKAPV